MLKLSEIRKVYKSGENEVEALKGSTLTFRETEFVSILGPSGCGKTTMLNIIGGLDRYTSGDLVIDGISTKNYKDKNWDNYRNKKIGFVFQSYNLIMHLNVLANVEMGLTLSGINKKERNERALAALKRVGLENHVKKRPNQLSGGQMQRVAIARAIVNNPDIILADEPTGALDSETSVQVLDILKEISKEKLVIMVTHNESLAYEYSTRIINMLDGNITGDTNPIQKSEISKLENDKIKKLKENQTKKRKKEKTRMGLFTSMFLSLRNLSTKKGRTTLTAFAGSIGIIGVALILALSNGFNMYIAKMQADTLSTYPLTINESRLDISGMLNSMRNANSSPSGNENEIVIDKISERMLTEMTKTNNLTSTYITETIETIPSNLIYGVTYNYKVELNIYNKFPGINPGETTYKNITNSSLNSNNFISMLESGSESGWTQILEDPTLVQSQYDLIAGTYPTSYNQVLLVVNKNNTLSDSVLSSLGLYQMGSKTTSLTFDELLNTKFKLLPSNVVYEYNGSYFNEHEITESNFNSGTDINICGIIRLNSTTNIGAISGSIAYLPSLITEIHKLEKQILEENNNNNITTWLLNNLNKNPFKASGTFDDVTITNTPEAQYQNLLSNLGISNTVRGISIYATSFDAKNEIKAHLDAYNDLQESADDKVYYSDVMEIMMKTVSTMVDAISYVLIAFTSVSLIVSSIMIGIITYASVLERTKEIGVLRSLGARKRDISRVFNTETIIIGLLAGIIGVFATLLLTLPINKLLKKYVEGVGNLAVVNPSHAFTLITISVILTLIAGLIPAKVASKKDPVVALRTE